MKVECWGFCLTMNVFRPQGVQSSRWVGVDCLPAAVKIISMMRGSVASVALVVFLLMARAGQAQLPVPSVDGQVALMPGADLDELLKPIALYPDPLLAELLPAATLPAEIVLADRFMGQGNDVSQIDFQPWDPCIKAIAHYPELLKWLDDNLNWTTELGQAFINQQQDVMDSIQRLRGQAQVLGNLPDTSQETVVNDDGEIDIEPAIPDQIDLPVYDPNAIYDQSGVYASFGIGWPIGPWLANDWNWRDGRIVTWGMDHPRPGDWWRRSPRQRVGAIARGGGGGVWHPAGRGYGYVSAARSADRGWASLDMRGNGRGQVGRSGGGMTGRPVARPATAGPAGRSFVARSGFVGGRSGEPRASIQTGASVESNPFAQSRPAFESRPAFDSRAAFESRPAFDSRAAFESRPAIESRPAFESRGSAGVGFFGGPQNSFEARQSSARGMESRGMAPAAGGGGGFRRR